MSASEYLSSESSEHLPRTAFENVNVSQIYDDLGLEYENYILDDSGRARSTEWVISQLSQEWHDENRDKGFYIVDLGCASGRPTVETIANSLRDQSPPSNSTNRDEGKNESKHRVVGVDISPVQLEHAHQRITKVNPIAQFEHGDIRTWSPPTSRLTDNGIDAVLSFYAINHLPLEDFHMLVQRMAGWLKSGGIFTLGSVAHVNGPVKWLGYDVTATSLPLDELKDLVERSGCKVEQAWEEEWNSKTRKEARKKVNQFVLAVKQ